MDMPDADPKIREQLFQGIRHIRNATIGLFASICLVFGLGLFNAYQQRAELNTEVLRIDHALCTFVSDLERRANDTREYLRKHEGREPIPGITRADLRRSLQAQLSTLESFEELRCPE